MNSFYIYRLPDEKRFRFGLGSTQNGIHKGFVISSFYNRPEATLTIVAEKEYKSDLKDLEITTILKDFPFSFSLLSPIPNYTIFKDEYLSKVKEIVGVLDKGEKTVFSRTITGLGKLKIAKTLERLNLAFPGAMVFCFFSPYTGIWIGATPEKLLQSSDGILSTVALAGTRVSDETERAWDPKNIEEQRMVTEYISNVFQTYGIEVNFSSYPSTKKAGPIEHLETEFQTLRQHNMDVRSLTKFLYTLSPTPALCGLPKDKAYQTIEKLEDFPRSFYGGFIGPYETSQNFIFYVLLRSVQFAEGRWCMNVGSGITKDSVPEEEWEETRHKAESILDMIDFIWPKSYF